MQLFSHWIISPISTTTTAIALFDDAVGTKLRNSSVLISTGGAMTGAKTIQVDGNLLISLGSIALTTGNFTLQAGSGGVIEFRSDTLTRTNQFHYLGNSNSSSLTYDGTNLCINPKSAGSGVLIIGASAASINASMQASGIAAVGKVVVNTGVKLYLEGTNLTEGDSYFVFNSGTTDINCFVDNVKVTTWDNDAFESHQDVKLLVAGKGLYVKEGTDCTMGVDTLVAGTVTVNTTKVTANSRIFLTTQSPSGTLGAVYVSARTAGTSFTITSLNVLDTSTVAWLIVEPS